MALAWPVRSRPMRSTQHSWSLPARPESTSRTSKPHTQPPRSRAPPVGRQARRCPAGCYGEPSNAAPIKNPRWPLVQWITWADSQALGSSGASSRT